MRILYWILSKIVRFIGYVFFFCGLPFMSVAFCVLAIAERLEER